MTRRRSSAGAVVCCAIGGLLVLLAGGREWAHATLSGVSGAGDVHLSVTGHGVAPSLPALGLALLALSAAILAASGIMRRAVGVLVLVVAGSAVGVSIGARSDVSAALEHREVGVQGLAVHAGANGWWLVALIGGLLAVGAGAATVIHAARWSAMGEKYDAPTAPKPGRDPAAVAWDALDRGEDPTA
jgi:uncharacterized membrane protein (TIGR02234 family)